MAISRRQFQDIDRADRNQKDAMDRVTQAKLDGLPASRIRKLEGEAIQAARDVNQAIRKR